MTEEHKSLAPVVVSPGHRLAPIVDKALAQAQGPEALRELLAVQRDWEAGEARKAFARSLVALNRDLPSTVAKDKAVDFTSQKGRTYYRHTTLALVMDLADEYLPQHGFALSWSTAQSDRGVITVACRLLHEDGHSEETSLASQPDTSGSKGPAQAIASTVTYLKRYTAMSLLGLASGDEREPHGPQSTETQEDADDDEVNEARNRAAASKLVRLGLAISAAQEHIGRPVKEWTRADLASLGEWVGEQREKGDSNG